MQSLGVVTHWLISPCANGSFWDTGIRKILRQKPSILAAAAGHAFFEKSEEGQARSASSATAQDAGDLDTRALVLFDHVVRFLDVNDNLETVISGYSALWMRPEFRHSAETKLHMKQQAPRNTRSFGLVELFDAANQTRASFEAFAGDVVMRAGLQAMDTVYVDGTPLMHADGSPVRRLHCCVKPRKRTAERIALVHNGDAKQVCDVLRCSIVVDNEQQILDVAESIRQLCAAVSGPRIVRLMNRFQERPFDGYGDFLYNISIQTPNISPATRHICEVQLHLSAVFAFKPTSGPLHSIFSDYFGTNLDAQAPRMRALYRLRRKRPLITTTEVLLNEIKTEGEEVCYSIAKLFRDVSMHDFVISLMSEVETEIDGRLRAFVVQGASVEARAQLAENVELLADVYEMREQKRPLKEQRYLCMQKAYMLWKNAATLWRSLARHDLQFRERLALAQSRVASSGARSTAKHCVGHAEYAPSDPMTVLAPALDAAQEAVEIFTELDDGQLAVACVLNMHLSISICSVRCDLYV